MSTIATSPKNDGTEIPQIDKEEILKVYVRPYLDSLAQTFASCASPTPRLTTSEIGRPEITTESKCLDSLDVTAAPATRMGVMAPKLPMAADGTFLRPEGLPAPTIRSPNPPPKKETKKVGRSRSRNVKSEEHCLNIIARSNGKPDIKMTPIKDSTKFGSAASIDTAGSTASQGSLRHMSDEDFEALKVQKMEAKEKEAREAPPAERRRRRRVKTGVLGLAQWKSDLIIYEVAHIILRNNGSQLMARLGAVMSPVGRQILLNEECKLKRFIQAVPNLFRMNGQSGIETIEFVGDLAALRKPIAKAILADEELEADTEAVQEALDYHVKQFDIDGRTITTMAQCLDEIRNIMQHCADGKLLMSQFGARLRPEVRNFLRDTNIKLQVFLEMFPDEFVMSGPCGKESMTLCPDKQWCSDKVVEEKQHLFKLPASVRAKTPWLAPNVDPTKADISKAASFDESPFGMQKPTKGKGKGKGQAKGKGKGGKSYSAQAESGPEQEMTPVWARDRSRRGKQRVPKASARTPTPATIYDAWLHADQGQMPWSPLNQFGMPHQAPYQGDMFSSNFMANAFMPMMPMQPPMQPETPMMPMQPETPMMPMQPEIPAGGLQRQMTMQSDAVGMTPSTRGQFDRLLTFDQSQLTQMISQSVPACYED